MTELERKMYTERISKFIQGVAVTKLEQFVKELNENLPEGWLAEIDDRLFLYDVNLFSDSILVGWWSRSEDEWADFRYSLLTEEVALTLEPVLEALKGIWDEQN